MSEQFKVSVSSEFYEGKMTEALKAATDAAVEMLANQVHSDCSALVPMQEGNLRDSYEMTKTGDCKRTLSWNTIYALFQYYGCWPDGSHQIKNHTTAGTTTMWFDVAKANCGENWQTVFEQAFKKEWGE
jgi:hypothetical protein